MLCCPCFVYISTCKHLVVKFLTYFCDIYTCSIMVLLSWTLLTMLRLLPVPSCGHYHNHSLPYMQGPVFALSGCYFHGHHSTVKAHISWTSKPNNDGRLSFDCQDNFLIVIVRYVSDRCFVMKPEKATQRLTEYLKNIWKNRSFLDECLTYH